MGIALNQIAPEMASAYVDTTTRNIERQLSRREPRPRALFPQYYRRGVCGRVCGRADELIRDDLRNAGRQGLAWFEMRGEPRERPRDVWEMREVAGLLAAYGSPDEHVRLDGLPVSRWYHPAKPEFEASALAYRLFARFLVTKQVASDDVVALEDQLASSGLHPIHSQVIAPIAQCLSAIQHDDAHDFERAWSTLTNAFATVAQHGEFARRFEGLLDPMALGLLALGRSHGFELTVTSPYAPLELLTAPATEDAPVPVGAA